MKSNSKNANGKRYLIKRLPGTDEWVVRIIDANGRHLEVCDYYTDDLDDAERTRDAMIERDAR